MIIKGYRKETPTAVEINEYLTTLRMEVDR